MLELITTLNQELKQIEDFLICGICYEHLDTSVITPCSHNYCSLCIRKYLHYKTQCPACFEETFEKDLRINKTLDGILLNFMKFKDKLRETISKIPSSSSIQPKEFAYNTVIKDPTSPSHSPFDLPNVLHSPSIPSPSNLNSPSTSGRSKMLSFFTPKSSKKVWTCFTSNTDRSKTVNCPVCDVNVPEAHINKHLDECLKRETIKEPLISNLGPKRKPHPKLVSNLMKDSVLRKKLKEYGLSCNGDRKTLESRLQRYIVVYNAECDRPNPRSNSEIIKQCTEEETTEKKSFNTSFFENRLQVTRNNTESTIEKARKKYLEDNKNSFFNLIAKLRENSKSSPPKSMKMDRNDEETDHPVKDISESDSDTSCPLLMYSRNEDCDSSYFAIDSPKETVVSSEQSPKSTTIDSKSEGIDNFTAEDYLLVENLLDVSTEDPETNNAMNNDKENREIDTNVNKLDHTPVRRSTRKRNPISDNPSTDRKVTKRRKKNQNIHLDSVQHDHGNYENNAQVNEPIHDQGLT